MSSDIETFTELAARILARPARCGPVRLIAIDGPGGAGKSTFAARLADGLGQASVVHTDDFASWDNPLNWWPRLEQQVLQPLEAGHTGRFQRYDWDRRALADWHEVPAVGVVILEGVSSARRAVAQRLTYAVWIQVDPQVRLQRGLERDGQEALGLWQGWMADEDRHFEQDQAAQRADLLVDGDPRIPHDPRSDFVRSR
ncbi:4-amino-4-deoxychorismate synthase [Catenulispora yoronensis]|uniref:4-amino-4-deoxychorismate synthase n=2 Tax=Catenulispora yoronensis TaxID=450799 RepID=A0ABP5F6C1_9ACTN